MRCGLEATDCIIEHWCPPLGLRAESTNHWRGPCPVCGRRRSLSVQVKNRRAVWNLLICGCDRRTVRKALPDCAARRSPRPVIDAEQLRELALAKMPPMSLRLALLEMSGMSTPDALDALGIRRENRSRVSSKRMQNRRSG